MSDEQQDARLIEDHDLKALLECWSVPPIPQSLDNRVVAAYRSEMSEAANTSNSVLLAQRDSEVVNMNQKQCPTCHEQFAEKFSFCPVDGTPLNGFAAQKIEPVSTENETVTAWNAFARDNFGASKAAAAPVSVAAAAADELTHTLATGREEYHLTIMEDAGLTNRLMKELREVAHESQLTWPELKRDPFGFTKRTASAYGLLVWRFFSRPNVAIGTSTAIFVVVSSVIGIIMFDQYRARKQAELAALNPDVELQQLVDTNIPAEEDKPKPDKGIGTGKGGRVGFNKGGGEGSKPEFKKASGGGGGGMEEKLPAQQGKLPPPSDIPAAIPKAPPIHQQSLPVAGMDIDPALWKNLPFPNYGDPRSNSKEPSNGPGKGNGMGTGEGVGVGEGEGGGFGRGRGGNMGGGDKGLGGGGSGGGTGSNGLDYGRTFRMSEVTQKARIISKPEPLFTEEARKNQTTGVVRISLVLNANGQVSNIRAVTRLPYGLTEKAIEAARQIRFEPAMKDGHKVSQFATIDYSFNIY